MALLGAFVLQALAEAVAASQVGVLGPGFTVSSA